MRSPSPLRSPCLKLHVQSVLPIFLGQLAGLVAYADSVKDDAFKAVSILRKMGTTVILMTGDNKRTAECIARQVELLFKLARPLFIAATICGR